MFGGRENPEAVQPQAHPGEGGDDGADLAGGPAAADRAEADPVLGGQVHPGGGVQLDAAQVVLEFR